MAKDIKVEIVGDASGLKKSLKEAEGATEGVGSGFDKLKKQIAGAFVAGAAVDFVGDAITAASDFNETMAKSEVIFGDASDAVVEFSEDAATSLGLSKQSALDASATFATFGEGAGIAGEELVGFSTEMTTLAADMASFSNTSPEQAIEAIGAALRGESEPIRKYGVLLDDATLKQRAMELGIYDGTGSLTQQQRVLSAQAEILAQTSNAQGDFARTSGGLAGQTKILSAEFANAKVQLGEKMLPAALEVTKALTKLVELTGKLGSVSDAVFGHAPDKVNDYTKALNEADSAETRLSSATSETDRETRKLIDSFNLATTVLDHGAIGVANLNDQLEAQSRAATDAARKAESLAKATLELYESQLKAIGSSGDFEQSVRDLDSSFYELQTQMMENAKTQADATVSDRDKEQSARDLASAEHDLSGDVFDVALQYSEQTGATKGSREQTDRMRESLELAKAKYPELRDEINQYIEALMRIPGAVFTEVNLKSSQVGGPRIALAEGGIVKATPGGTLAVIGEGGHDEAVIPLDGKHGGGGAGVTNNHYTINMPVGTKPDEMMRTLEKWRQRNGNASWMAPAGGISGGTP